MSAAYNDENLTCQWGQRGSQLCGAAFVWTAKDQEFYSDKGFTRPKYCREHREARRAMQQEREATAPQQEFQQGRKNDRARGPRVSGHHSDRDFLEDGE